MNPIKTFKKGGVHPEENKLSADMPIQDFPMPKQIIVPLGQCLGAPAECIVNKGDHVLYVVSILKDFVSHLILLHVVNQNARRKQDM